MTTAKTKPKKARRAAINSDFIFEQELEIVAALITEQQYQEAELAKAIDKLNANYGNAIKDIKVEITASVKRCETYATDNEERLFPDGGERITTTALASYGFRTLPKSLKLRSKQTWAKVLAAVKQLGKPELIRKTEEADREVLERQTPDLLKSVGLKYEGEKKFFVKNKGDA